MKSQKRMKIKMNNLDYVEEYDKLKTKVLKYIIYKKRTEKEIRQKFSKTIDEDILEDIIDELKENGYIDDLNCCFKKSIYQRNKV